MSRVNVITAPTSCLRQLCRSRAMQDTCCATLHDLSTVGTVAAVLMLVWPGLELNGQCIATIAILAMESIVAALCSAKLKRGGSQ